MTNKQKRFCDEYLIDCNGTRAYKAAYSSVKKDNTAAASATALLRNPNVQKYIATAAEKLHNEKTADAQEVLEYLTCVLRGTAKSHEIVVEGTGDGCSEAREVEKRPSEKDRLKAAELLAKRYGLLTDNVKLDGEGVVQIVDDIPQASKTD